MAPELTAAIVTFTYLNVSQGSVATQLSCGGIYLITASLKIFNRLCRWKNFENRSVFGKDMNKSLVTFLTDGISASVYARPSFFVRIGLNCVRKYALASLNRNSTLQCESNPHPWGFLTFFPKRLGIFSANFTRLLYVPIYARWHIFYSIIWVVLGMIKMAVVYFSRRSF